MPELERELRELRVDWPATPDLASAVAARIAAEPAPRPRHRRRAPRRWRPALAALLVLLGGGLAVSPDARSWLLETLGLKGARIEFREPTATPAPTQPPLGAGLELGRPVGLARARREAGFTVPAPTGIGEAGAVYFSEGPPDEGRVSFVYDEVDGVERSSATGVALLVTVFPATVEPVIGKSAASASDVERVEVDGDPGYFVTGSHGFAWATNDGSDVRFEPERLAGNTLLLERGGLLIRIEGEIGRDRAIAIARSIR